MDPIRKRGWILKITVMSLVLGMLIAASLRTQHNVKNVTGVGGLGFNELAALYQGKNRENLKLRQQIGELDSKNTELLNAMAKRTSDSSLINNELQDAKFLAGLTDVEGPGVTVTLRDSDKMVPDTDPLGPQGYIIHDLDIRDVTNELKAAGAEAISVNEQRLIATSAVRCAGPVILTNDVDIAEPYIIKAIGDPKTLESALRMRGGIVERLPDPKMITIEQQKDLFVERYNGSRQFKYAKPTEPAAEKN